jgi:hypothetical protein
MVEDRLMRYTSFARDVRERDVLVGQLERELQRRVGDAVPRGGHAGGPRARGVGLPPRHFHLIVSQSCV